MATLSVDISWSRWPPGRQDSASRLPTIHVDSVWFIDKTRHSQNLFQRVYHRNYGILGYWGLYCVAFDILNVYIWDRQDLGGPHVGPMNCSTWDYIPISGKLTSAQLLIGKFGGIPLYYIAMDSKMLTESWFTTNAIMQYDKVTINPHIDCRSNALELVISRDQRYTNT